MLLVTYFAKSRLGYVGIIFWLPHAQTFLPRAMELYVQVYPKSAALLQLLIDLERQSYMTALLRMKVSQVCQQNESVPQWLVAARLEGLQSQASHLLKVPFGQSVLKTASREQIMICIEDKTECCPSYLIPDRSPGFSNI